MDLQAFWQAVLRQDSTALRPYFHPEACIRWHNTNERFTVEEFICANCEYPGQWAGELERMEAHCDGAVTVAHVHSVDGALSFHAVSFFQFQKDKIFLLDEYWGDDGPAPQWRLDKHLGRPIR